MGRGSAKSLAPGFRFHPTDEELVRYYLKRKVSNKPFRFDPISVVDIYKSEPWDLPAKSRLNSRDLEWYFFSMLDKKYGNGSKTNRATEKGYWKTTGKDRPIHHGPRTVGMKKTLVYHLGRAPRGERSNWVMHEYRLSDEELEKTGIVQDAFVLCRIFQKSGTGPKNGEQYGAPFVEEEWEDDELTLVPEEVTVAEEVVVGNDAYAETDDLDQNLDIGILSENDSLPLNLYHGDTSNYVEQSGDFIEDDQKPLLDIDETHCESELCDDQNNCDFLEQYEMDAKLVKDEYFVESSNDVNPVEVNYLLDEPYLDATDNPLNGAGLFLETNDLSNPTAAGSSGFDMVEEYLPFFDADDDISQYLDFDSSEMVGGENSISDQALLTPKLENGEAEQMPMTSQHLPESNGNNDAPSSMQNPEATEFESDVKYPFLKQASQMLGGSFPAPPAFASEFHTKEAALRTQPSSSVNVTTGMIRIRNMTISCSGIDCSLDKSGNINFVLSLDLSRDGVSSTSLTPSLFSGKARPVVTRGWLYFMFFSVLILSVTCKIGTLYLCQANQQK